jgi:hypothetical protein
MTTTTPAPLFAAVPEIITWPEGVAAICGVGEVTLKRDQARGNHPKLYAVTTRNLVTTRDDLMEWLRAKEVPVGYRARTASPGAYQAAGEREA